MQKKTLVILQNTKEQIEELKEKFIRDGEFEVVGESVDGITGISLINEKKPQFVITEMVLLGYDGLCVIDRLKSMGIKSKILVLSAIHSEEIISKATALGADYYMAKPFDFNLLKDRISQLETKTEKTNKSVNEGFHRFSLDEKISNIFINVGIPPHIKGYSFLREGVKMAVEEPSIINNITKKLYPMIGEKYHTTASKVERAIRHAIEVAWNRGRIDSINGILGVRAYVGAEKPTNGEFIALVADKMLLERS